MRACAAWGAQIPAVGSNPGWEPLAVSEGKGLNTQGRRGQVPDALRRVGMQRGPRAERGRGRRGAGCADLGRQTEPSGGGGTGAEPRQPGAQPRSRDTARGSALRSAPAAAGQRYQERPRAAGCGDPRLPCSPLSSPGGPNPPPGTQGRASSGGRAGPRQPSPSFPSKKP